MCTTWPDCPKVPPLDDRGTACERPCNDNHLYNGNQLCPYGDNYIEARQKCPQVKTMNDDMAENAKEYTKEIERLTAIIDAVRVQAQCWAQEARAQRGTVHRIYESVTNKAGEQGDWNGEKPVVAELALKDKVIELMAEWINHEAWELFAYDIPAGKDYSGMTCKKCITTHFTEQARKELEP